MATNIRPELSKKNPYYISKHRYYELKHFCLQYPEWKRELRYGVKGGMVNLETEGGDIPDQTAEDAIHNDILLRKIGIVERLCREVGGDLSEYLFESVTKGASYVRLRTIRGIPCCKDTFYDIYRRFFWELSRIFHSLY